MVLQFHLMRKYLSSAWSSYYFEDQVCLSYNYNFAAACCDAILCLLSLLGTQVSFVSSTQNSQAYLLIISLGYAAIVKSPSCEIFSGNGAYVFQERVVYVACCHSQDYLLCSFYFKYCTFRKCSRSRIYWTVFVSCSRNNPLIISRKIIVCLHLSNSCSPENSTYWMVHHASASGTSPKDSSLITFCARRQVCCVALVTYLHGAGCFMVLALVVPSNSMMS